MLRHYLIAALRNLAANKLQSAIAIFGLAVGLAGAITAALAVRNQTGFDDFLPDHDRIYMATVVATMGGRAPDYLPYTPHDLAPRLSYDFPEIEAVARFKDGEHALRNGAVEAREATYSADANIFRILRLPVLYGDLDRALTRPDTVVIPRAIARKYFGRDDVVGQTLQIDRRRPITITAVIEDLPPNGTNLNTAVFLSGRGPASDLAVVEKMPANAPNGNFGLDLQTLVKLKPGTSRVALQARMIAMRDSLLPRPAAISADLRLMRLDELHISPDFSPGLADRVAAIAGVAMLILFLSVVNFVNLATARASRRGVEVGVRKAAGAARPTLMVQFLGESTLQALFALCLALAMVEWALPAVNAFLNSGAALDYREPALVAELLSGVIAVGVLAGAYPALLLSAFRPATVLKGLGAYAPKAGLIRQSLVTAQFAVLAMLMVATGAVLAQHDFAARQTHGLETGDRLFVYVPQCEGTFADKVRALPGVKAVACSNASFLQEESFFLANLPGGGTTALYRLFAGPGLIELYGQHPIAGRTLGEADAVDYSKPMNVIVNATAARNLGFSSPQAAIGRTVRGVNLPPGIIVGVVRDFSVSALENKINPMIAYYRPRAPDSLLHIQLDGRNEPATLAAIDAAWDQSGATAPIRRVFMSTFIGNLRLSLLREGQAFAIFAAIAIVLACLGLIGITVATAERRVKEIGVRKVMGASSAEITALLLWQFAKPVLWANIIAWPVAFWAMNRWLSGFAYHVDLPLWLFPAVGLATVLIALLTVAGQAWLVARQRPVLALRYE